MPFFRLFGSGRPTAADAARRLFLLRVLVMNAQEQLATEQRGGTRRTGLTAPTRHALERLDVWRGATRRERELVGRLDAGWSEQEIVDTLWRAEAVVCLLWALGLLEAIPPFDAPAEAEALERVPQPQDFAAFLARASLRPSAQLDEARSLAELWHWRARTRQLTESGAPVPEALPAGGLDAVVGQVAAMAEESGTLATVGGDFRARGRAYRDLSQQEYELAHSLARERHHAFNWLCGRARNKDWDSTSIDT